jgi:hypothetical protein
VSPGILIASISGRRAASLFNTRVKTAVDEDDNINVELEEGTLADSDSMLTDSNLDDNNFTDSDTTLVDRNLDDGTFTDSDSTMTHREDLRDDSDVNGGVVSDSDGYIFSDLDVSTEEDTDSDNETDSYIFNDTERDADSDFYCQADDSSVTDDECDAGPEVTRTILWRHVAFHIIRSPVQGRPNVLIAKVTLLHPKGEDRKPRT